MFTYSFQYGDADDSIVKHSKHDTDTPDAQICNTAALSRAEEAAAAALSLNKGNAVGAIVDMLNVYFRRQPTDQMVAT